MHARWICRNLLCLLTLAAAALSACAPAVHPPLQARPAVPTDTAAAHGKQVTPTARPTPTWTATSAGVWVSPALPGAFREALTLPANLPYAANRTNATLRVEIAPPEGCLPGAAQSYWVYALAAPFPTLEDTVTIQDIQYAWTGKKGALLHDTPLLVTRETRAAFTAAWGAPAQGAVRELSGDSILDEAWRSSAWALIPFEVVEPRWKILRVSGQSPMENNFDSSSYPLSLTVCASGQPAIQHLPTNRDPSQLTVLTMTGVTAMSRHIAQRMESKGIAYPARDIGAWLAEADLTHISNEVSFYQNCPKPGPERVDMRFCSSPRYIELLAIAGADIIELTGNHLLDWGREPFLYTLDLYRQRGWDVYGGGANLDEARAPLLVEHNGNRLAFLGCSPAGPANIWARTDAPGPAPCDFPQLEAEIGALRAKGILPIVTLQAVEADTYTPPPAQGAPNFRRLARAGAVIVSGSQSHVPQVMTFVEAEQGHSFVHYGLGNLFFDQMDPVETRQQFIDRHTFYQGKYLGVELRTALLEDYARPRPMNEAERREFLEKIFSLSRWNEE